MNRDNIPHDTSAPAGRPSERASMRGEEEEIEMASMEEAKRLVAKAREVASNLGQQIDAQVHERPYVVLGAVAGVGFAAGALFGSRLGQFTLAVAAGYGLHSLMSREGGGEGGQRVRRFVREGINKLSSQERAKG